MAHGKEIEIKWKSEHVKRTDFMNFMTTQLQKLKITKFKYLSVMGPDHYWKNSTKHISNSAKEIMKMLGITDREKLSKIKDIMADNLPKNTVRHRVSPETNELTTKARLTTDSITVRAELNIPLDIAKVKQKDVNDWFKLNSYEKRITITKDCDIWWVPYEDGAMVSTVWYECYVDDVPNKIFIEVEVEGATEERSLEILNYWRNQLRFHLKLTDDLISEDSLYEIYTGEKYKKV